MEIEDISGINYAEAIERFSGNAELYEKFLIRYLDETACRNAKSAMENEDYAQAFEQIHSMKGESGNLSITGVYEACSRFTKAYRSGEYSSLPAIFETIEQEHKKICDEIQKIGV